MNNHLIFPMLFFMAFILYLQMGMTIIPFRHKSRINRVVFIICFAMSLWSLGYSMANSAPSYEIALLWRRIAAIGRSLIFSLFLHFVLIVFKIIPDSWKKWSIVPLYLPAIASIYAFALHPSIAPSQYNLSLTSVGWINHSTNNYIDWLFNAYFITYILVGFVLIVRARQKSNILSKKLLNIMLLTIVATVLISTITDIVLNIYIPSNIPQIAPLIILLPVISIYYSIRRNSMLSLHQKVSITSNGNILNEVSHAKLYSSMAIIYFYGGFACFVAMYFMLGDPIIRILSITSGFFIVGLLIHYINLRHIESNRKDIIIACITAITIPFLYLFFIETAAISIWVTPAIMIVFTILINNRTVFIINSVAAIFSIVLIGLKVPETLVQVGAADHFVRVTLLVSFIMIANYINQVFIKRLKENEDQIRRQKLISYISTEFALVDKSNIDLKFMEALQLYAEDFSVDLSYVYLLSEDEKTVKCTYEYCLEGKKYYPMNKDEVILDNFPWWLNQLKQSKLINIEDVSTLPKEAIEEMKTLIGHELNSMLVTPIMDNGIAMGVMGFCCIERRCYWTDTAIDIAGIIAQHFADTLIKMKSNKEIEFLAYYDALTGLPNRSLFKKSLDKEIQLCHRTKRNIGVLFVDLDSFKSINDTLGHDCGDELLINIANKLIHRLREHDTVSRFGGDEFLIMVNNIDNTEHLTHIADNIIKIFETPTFIGEHEIFITASMGISVYPNDGTTTNTLIKKADRAMYMAKELGKNRYSFYSSLPKEDVLMKMKLRHSLYHALERNELELYYQPQVSTHNKKIVGLEALLRWNHPELGMVPPLKFIHLAEQTGLIVPIGEWVIRTACEQSMKWQSMGLDPIRMAVNLSVKQFRSDLLVETVQNILTETKINPNYLELEITESIAIKGTEHIIEVLKKLKELGITISIDDFGTEYSSLSRIKVMPIDRIKMDMHFVQSISNSSKDDAIVRIIIQLAQSLNLELIAEGVETEQQLDFLTRQSCDEVQGYYYYKPMKTSEIERILIENKEINFDNT